MSDQRPGSEYGKGTSVGRGGAGTNSPKIETVAIARPGQTTQLVRKTSLSEWKKAGWHVATSDDAPVGQMNPIEPVNPAYEGAPIAAQRPGTGNVGSAIPTSAAQGQSAANQQAAQDSQDKSMSLEAQGFAPEYTNLEGATPAQIKQYLKDNPDIDPHRVFKTAQEIAAMPPEQQAKWRPINNDTRTIIHEMLSGKGFPGLGGVRVAARSSAAENENKLTDPSKRDVPKTTADAPKTTADAPKTTGDNGPAVPQDMSNRGVGNRYATETERLSRAADKINQRFGLKMGTGGGLNRFGQGQAFQSGAGIYKPEALETEEMRQQGIDRGLMAQSEQAERQRVAAERAFETKLTTDKAYFNELQRSIDRWQKYGLPIEALMELKQNITDPTQLRIASYAIFGVEPPSALTELVDHLVQYGMGYFAEKFPSLGLKGGFTGRGIQPQ